MRKLLIFLIIIQGVKWVILNFLEGEIPYENTIHDKYIWENI